MWVKRQTTKGAVELMKHLFPKVCNFSLSLRPFVPSHKWVSFPDCQEHTQKRRRSDGPPACAFPLFASHKWHSRTNTRHLPARRPESGAQTSGLFVLPPIMHPIAIVLNQVADSAYFCPPTANRLPFIWKVGISRRRAKMLHGAGCTLMCCTAHISAKCTRTENEWASALPAAVSLTLEWITGAHRFVERCSFASQVLRTDKKRPEQMMWRLINWVTRLSARLSIGRHLGLMWRRSLSPGWRSFCGTKYAIFALGLSGGAIIAK